MFDVLCGTVVRAVVVKSEIAAPRSGLGNSAWRNSGGGRCICLPRKEMAWVVCGFIQQDRAVERSVYKMERKKEGRICETGVDNAFRFLTLGLGACAWLPLHALEHTPFLECSRGGRGGIRDCACMCVSLWKDAMPSGQSPVESLSQRCCNGADTG